MENQYDNEFMRKQLYDMFGKPKGVTYEDFREELDKMVAEFNEQDIEIRKFKKEYREKHKYCPKCGAEPHISTLVGYAVSLDKKEEYKNLNNCFCSVCGDKHTTHDRVGSVS